jgi:glycosyltransferase involved in cell wall biosynthesis
MKPRHICIFPDRLDNGGIGRYAINLAEALIDQGAKVDLFVTAPTGELFQQRPPQARLFVGGGSSKKSVWTLFQYLRRERPDLLITATSYIDVLSIVVNKLALNPSQQVVTIHTARSADDMAGKEKLKSIYDSLCRRLYPFSKHMGTNCPGGSAEILQDGRYGALVSMKNPTTLAQAVINMLHSPPDPTTLKERGQVFSMEASAKKYLELGVS